jgi:HK97 gp10 family phage protein
MAQSAQLARLERRLQAIPKAVKQAVVPSLMKSGHELAGRMKQLAPVDEGDLRDSIHVTGPGQATPPYSQPGGSMVVAENAVAITVGNNDVRYPHLIEYGTANAPAQPFFWVSVRLLQKRLTNRIKRSIGKAVKEGWQS